MLKKKYLLLLALLLVVLAVPFHTTTSVTCGFSRSYNQAAQIPSSKVTYKSRGVRL